MKQAKLDGLNRELKRIMETGKDVAAAVDTIALAADLECIADNEDEAGVVTCRIYQTVDDDLVNCWLEGVEVGFDDQIEWYTDAEYALDTDGS